MSPMFSVVAIFGWFWFLGATARLFHDAGWEVIGLTRTEESARSLAEEPFRAVACDITEPRAVESIVRPATSTIGRPRASSSRWAEGASARRGGSILAASPAIRR